jgi:hypothetical protein
MQSRQFFSDAVDSKKTLRIRKLLSEAAQSRSEALKQLEALAVAQDSASRPCASNGIVQKREDHNILNHDRCGHCINDHNGEKEDTVSLREHADEQTESSRTQYATASAQGAAHSGSQQSLPHKRSTLIADVQPNNHSPGSCVLPATSFSEGHSFGSDGVEELRREIERLVEATDRAAARDVEIAELRAELRSRSVFSRPQRLCHPPFPQTINSRLIHDCFSCRSIADTTVFRAPAGLSNAWSRSDPLLRANHRRQGRHHLPPPRADP